MATWMKEAQARAMEREAEAATASEAAAETAGMEEGMEDRMEEGMEDRMEEGMEDRMGEGMEDRMEDRMENRVEDRMEAKTDSGVDMDKSTMEEVLSDRVRGLEAEEAKENPVERVAEKQAEKAVEGHSEAQEKKGQGDGFYTDDFVRQFGSYANCLVVIHGMVLNVTDYAPKHPGGKEKFQCGKDITAEYQAKHGSKVLEYSAQGAQPFGTSQNQEGWALSTPLLVFSLNMQRPTPRRAPSLPACCHSWKAGPQRNHCISSPPHPPLSAKFLPVLVRK